MNTIHRKLGSIETAMAASHVLANGTTQSALVISLEGSLTFSSLLQAAEVVFRKYALLRCAIQREADGFYFVAHNDFNRIPVRHVEVNGFDDWDQYETVTLHEAIDQTICLWRLTLFSSTAAASKRLVLAFHHAIIDSSGAKSVMTDLLTFSDHLMQNRLISFDLVGVPAAIDDFLKPSSGPAASANVAASMIRHADCVSLEHRRTRFLHEKMTASAYAPLADKCKKDRISPDAVFAAALALAACSSGLCLPPISTKTAVSLREYASMEVALDQSLGCYVAVADAVLDLEDNHLRSLAGEYHKKLLSYTLKHSLKKSEISLEQIINGTEKAKESTHFSSGIGITNTAEMSPSCSSTHFKVTDVYNITNRVLGNVALVLQVSTFREEVRFMFAYVAPLLKKEMAERVRHHFMEHLKNYYLVY